MGNSCRTLTSPPLRPAVCDIVVGVDWILRWRYWAAGAAVMVLIWGVEVLRKGDPIRPWPLVPLAIWAVVLVVHRRTRRPVG
jgi:hypothetical protein